MKKNLRIASATAAALLAVAPVAASAVPANAAVSINGNSSTPSDQNKVTNNTITINVAITPGFGNKLEGSTATVTASVGDKKLDSVTLPAKAVSVTNGSDSQADTTFVSGHSYKVKLTGLKLQGLPTNDKVTYSPASGSFSGDNTTNGKASATQLAQGVDYSDSVTINDSSLVGTPYFFEKASASATNGTVVSTGSVSVSNTQNDVSDVATAILDKYGVAVDAGSATDKLATIAMPLQAAVEQAVKTGLSAAGVTVDSQGKFTAPANSFTVNLSATATNNKTVNLPVLVSVGKTAESTTGYPQITATVSGITNSSAAVAANAQHFVGPNVTATVAKENAPAFTHVKVNGSVDTTAIKNAFKAQVNASTIDSVNVSVDASKVNTSVAGTYPVTVSATNPSGLTTKVTFNITVGDPDAKYQTVQQDGSVYSINGNNASATSTSVKKGDNVATYGTVTANGVSYTRINGKDANQFVETKVFSKSEEKTVTKKVMYKSAVYDKNGKTTGMYISGYTDTEFVAKDGKAEVVTINGGKFLKLAGDKGYVRQRNVDGSKMTLKHNAYAYKSNGKRANKKLYKKGTKITVYGGQYKAIRHYRKNAVRIGVNKYIKVVNVNYKLAD